MLLSDFNAKHKQWNSQNNNRTGNKPVQNFKKINNQMWITCLVNVKFFSLEKIQNKIDILY